MYLHIVKLPLLVGCAAYAACTTDIGDVLLTICVLLFSAPPIEADPAPRLRRSEESKPERSSREAPGPARAARTAMPDFEEILDLAKEPGSAIRSGAALFWNADALIATTIDTGTRRLGVAVRAAAAEDTVVRVRVFSIDFGSA